MGNCNWYVTGPSTFVISKGPSLFGPIFLWWFVFKFRVSSHTLSPFLNRVKVDLHRSIIRDRASSCAARASSRFLIRVCILLSMVGYLVFSNDRGTAMGEIGRASCRERVFNWV